MQTIRIMKKIALCLAVWLFTGTVMAQKEPVFPKGKSDQVALPKIPITKEMENRVIETVAPVVQRLEKLLKADPGGTYTAYVADVEKLGRLSNRDEKDKMIRQIQRKYYPFIKQKWDEAKIDEAYYQARLREIFPPEMRETIQFTEFLNFSVSGNSSKPAPPPAPAPRNICIDAVKSFFTIQDKTRTLNANTSVLVSNNLVTTGCGSAIAGHSFASGWILSDIRIPGSFPSDDKLLRITKNYRWSGSATAVSVLGCAFATISTSTDNFSTDAFVRTWAPVIFVSSVSRNEARLVQTLIKKQFLLNIRFGINCYSDCYSSVISGSVSDNMCDNLSWSVCEE